MADIPSVPIPDSTGKPKRDFSFPWRLAAALTAFGIIVLFALQNTESVDVNFLFWDFSIPLIVVIVATVVLSVVFGDMIGWWWKRRKRKHTEQS